MKRGKHDMAGKRRVDRQTGGFIVADFSDHNHVRVLTENLPQSRSEIIIYFRPNLRLVQTVNEIFNRIFQADDIDAVAVQNLHCRVQSRGFAGTGRPGD